MIDNDPLTVGFIVVCTGVFLGGFVAGFAGFGLAAAAGAFLLHVLEPKHAVPLMMICSVYAQCAGLAYLRKSMNAGWALPFIGGGLAGVPIAVMVLAEIEAGALRAGFGAFLIAYSTWALLSLYGITQRFSVRRTASASEIRAAHAAPSAPGPTVRDKVVVGLFAGLIGGLTAMPGALLSIWSDARQLSKAEQRAFVQPFILAMQLTALALMLTTPDLLTREVLSLLYISALPLLVGTFLSLYFYGRANAATFRLCVLAIVFASGCGLISH